MGPQDIQQATKNKPLIVTSSKTQKEANPFIQSLRSPRVNFPYCVRRQTEIPHVKVQ